MLLILGQLLGFPYASYVISDVFELFLYPDLELVVELDTALLAVMLPGLESLSSLATAFAVSVISCEIWRWSIGCELVA